MALNRALIREQAHHPRFFDIIGRFERDLIHGLVSHEPAQFQVPTRLRDDWQLAIAARDPEV